MNRIKLILALLLLPVLSFATPLPITGSFMICLGYTSTLADATPGGTWTSSNPAIATVGASTGIVTGISGGIATISYTDGTGSATQSVSVNATPGAISGPYDICVGSTGTMTDGTSGGTWSSSNPAVAPVGTTTGIVTGVAAGVTIITYSLPVSGCYATKSVTINPSPAPLSVGSSTVCVGGTTTISDATPGGTWSSSNPAVGTIGISGVFGGVSAGTTTISYVLASTGCGVMATMTVNGLPVMFTVTGGGSYCSGGAGVSVGLSGSSSGVTYQLFVGGTPVGSPVAGTGSALSFGLMTTAGTYTVVATNATTGCSATMTGSAVVTVVTVPTITATSSGPTCGGSETITASGATTYTWMPSTGLSCTTCATVVASPTSTTIYTITGTTGPCFGIGHATVDGNHISGHITYTGLSTDTFRVWLIQFNPSDSSIVALDSAYSCMDAGVPYYEFMDPAAGSYLVKARLLGTIPGTSGYIPTYSSSTPYWYAAASAAHTTASDVLDITMIYGTVPSGPGFISGYVYAGAGKGTTGDVPEPNMLVYLKDATTGNILTYTYTDALGYYSFAGLANSSYVVFPTDYHYYTTPSGVITLTTTDETVTNVRFKKHLTFGTITPYPTNVFAAAAATDMAVYPNPAKGYLNINWPVHNTEDVNVTITDVLGNKVFHSVLNIDARDKTSQVNLAGLADGIYVLSVKANDISYTSKLMIGK